MSQEKKDAKAETKSIKSADSKDKEIADLRRQLQTKEQELQGAASDIRAYESMRKAVQESKDQALQSLKDKEAKQAELDAKQQELKKAETNITYLTNQLKVAGEARQRAEERRDSAQNSQSSLQSIASQAEAKERDEKQRRQEAEAAELKAEQTLKEKQRNLDLAVEKLRKETVAFNEEKKKFTDEKARLTTTIERLTKEKAEVDAEIDKLQKQFGVLIGVKAERKQDAKEADNSWWNWIKSTATGWIDADVKAVSGNALTYDSSAIVTFSIAAAITSIRTLVEYSSMGDVVSATGGPGSTTPAATYLAISPEWKSTYDFYRIYNSVKDGLAGVLDITNGGTATALFAAMCTFVLADTLRAMIKFYQAERGKGFQAAFHSIAYNGENFDPYKLINSLLPGVIVATGIKFGIDFNALPDYVRGTLGVSDDKLSAADCHVTIDPQNQSCYISSVNQAVKLLGLLVPPAAGVILGSIATLSLAHTTTQIVSSFAQNAMPTIRWCREKCRTPAEAPLLDEEREGEGLRRRRA